MMEVGRRQFLKIIGTAGTAAAAGGCSDSARKLIPYVLPPEDLVPGRATWYASTCRACPAGCGLLAKNRDGRVIKLEGNPLHPVSGGKLCARGQASLQGLYNPDRYRGPMRRAANASFQPIGWEEGEALLARHLRELIEAGKGERIVFLSELMTGTLSDLTALWLREMGQPAGPVLYEPFAYEPLRAANRAVFDQDAIPRYRIDRADFLISFGAGFLETWLSNVEYARQFGDFHALREGGRHPFVYVGPRLSITANNADIWIPVAPGDEYLIGLAILRTLIDDNLLPQLPVTRKAALASMTDDWPLEKISARTGADPDLIRRVAHLFAAAQRPLALAEGLGLSGPAPVESAVAANLLCTLAPGSAEAIDFSGASAYGAAASHAAVRELAERMARGGSGSAPRLGRQPALHPPVLLGVPEEPLRRSHGGESFELRGRDEHPRPPGAPHPHAARILGGLLPAQRCGGNPAAGDGPCFRHPPPGRPAALRGKEREGAGAVSLEGFLRLPAGLLEGALAQSGSGPPLRHLLAGGGHAGRGVEREGGRSADRCRDAPRLGLPSRRGRASGRAFEPLPLHHVPDGAVLRRAGRQSPLDPGVPGPHDPDHLGGDGWRSIRRRRASSE